MSAERIDDLVIRRCVHLERGELVQHATMTFVTLPVGENSTDYVWEIQMDLCALCSGFLRGTLSGAPYVDTRLERP